MSTHTADDSTATPTSLGPFSSPGASPTPWDATEWALICEDGTWYQLGDAVRTGNVQLYRAQPDTHSADERKCCPAWLT
jgi:hypothetical protein